MANLLLPVVEEGLEEVSTELQNELIHQIALSLAKEDCVKVIRNPEEYDQTKDLLVVLHLAGWEKDKWPKWSEVWPGLGSRIATNIRKAEFLPVHPHGTDFNEVCPPELRRYNGICIDGVDVTSKAIVRRVMRMFKLSQDSRKGFISYRRSEASAVAYQLWLKLHEEGYDVFLDYISVEGGEDVQESLMERLSDASFVILLETPGIGDSPWVTYELAFARDHGLAVAVVTWPEVPPTARQSTVYPAWRFPTSIDWWEQGPAFGNELLAEARLNEVVSFVEDAHQNAMATRRQDIESLVSLNLRFKGKDFTINDFGHCEVSTGSGPVRFGSVARPPDVKDLWELSQGQRTSPHRNILVHPDLPISPERQQLLSWVIEGSCTAFTSSGDLSRIIDTLSAP